MRYNRKLLERFNGNVREIQRHCQKQGLSEVELNTHYDLADREMVKIEGSTGWYKRGKNPRYRTLGRWREGC